MNLSTIKGVNLELTETIKDYVTKKVEAIKKLCSRFEPAAELGVDVEKETNHHNKGAHFACHMKLQIPGTTLYAENRHEDMYAAIDQTQEDLRRQLKNYKDRKTEAKREPRPDKE